MRIIFGTTPVVTAGTRVRLSTTADAVKKIKFQPRAANTGRMFIGLADVSATVNGWELPIPLTGRDILPLELDFGDGSVLLNLFYVDGTITGTEIIDWVAIVNP